MHGLIFICLVLSCFGWRIAVVDQIDGGVALVELDGEELALVGLSCLPPRVREGERLIFAPGGTDSCPFILRRGFSPDEDRSTVLHQPERSPW